MLFARAKDLAKQYLSSYRQSLDLAQAILNHVVLSCTYLQLKLILLNGEKKNPLPGLTE